MYGQVNEMQELWFDNEGRQVSQVRCQGQGERQGLLMAGRTPKQAMADSKKRKAKPLTSGLPKVGAMPPAAPDLASLRAWVPKAKAKAISAKAKKLAIGKMK